MRGESSFLGRVLQFEGRLPEALAMIQSAFESARKLGDLFHKDSLLKWAAEEAMYLGRIPLALQCTKRRIELLEQRQLTGNRRSRLFTAHRHRSSFLPQSANPNEERHCDAIEALKLASEGQGDIFDQDPHLISRMIQAGTVLQMLSASQALFDKPEAIETAKRAIALFNSDKKRVNTDLDWHLAFAQLKISRDTVPNQTALLMRERRRLRSVYMERPQQNLPIFQLYFQP